MTKQPRPWLAALALCLLPPAAQAAGPRPVGLTRDVLSVERIDERVLGFVDVDFLRFEDQVSAQDAAGRAPYRVAEPIALEVSPETAGTRETLADGGTLWRLRVTSPGAVFLSFLLKDLSLPPGSRLSFYSVDRDFEAGPYTQEVHNQERRFGSPAIPGDSAVIELHAPAAAAGEPSFIVESVSHGYRDFNRFDRVPFRNGLRTVHEHLGGVFTTRSDCAVDVGCSAGSRWQADKRAVARTYDGRHLCTGALINNARQDCRPYFLTAAHCVSRSRTAATLTFYWNHESATCGGRAAPSRQTSSGSALRLTSPGSDVTLLELNSRPSSAYDTYYAGFSRSAKAPESAVAIHHPAGEAKKISVENDPVEDGDDGSGGDGSGDDGNGGWGATHWRIAGWDIGTTAGGSSGCPLFNPSHQIIGQLHGGTADCGGGWDEFGKLSASWAAGLSSWLDPDGSGLVSLGGKESSTCPGGKGCLARGSSCTAGAQCCSGRCPKKTRKCA